MFTLRRISGAKVEMNHFLGEHYTVIYRDINYEDFQRSFQTIFKKPHVADMDEASDDDTKKVYAFVGNGPYLQPLYMGQKAYIMTESGKTFDNLTCRP